MNKIKNLIEGLKLLNRERINVDLSKESILMDEFADPVILINPCKKCPDSIEAYKEIVDELYSEEMKHFSLNELYSFIKDEIDRNRYNEEKE